MRMTVNSGDNIPVSVRGSGSRTTTGSAVGGTLDHRRLTHKSDADQHTIGSITDLQGELDVRPDSALTNMEIEELL